MHEDDRCQQHMYFDDMYPEFAPPIHTQCPERATVMLAWPAIDPNGPFGDDYEAATMRFCGHHARLLLENEGGYDFTQPLLVN